MQSDVWGTVSPNGSISHITGGNFANSSITINGWLRDFLWSQASQVIQSYGSASSAYGLIFLGAHFIWAFSLMFLFSGRGYWQELIESIVWAHNKLNFAPTIPVPLNKGGGHWDEGFSPLEGIHATGCVHDLIDELTEKLFAIRHEMASFSADL